MLGIEPHKTTLRNTSRHSYIVGKLKMRISHLKKLLSDVDTYCFTHEGQNLQSVREGIDMRLKQCKSLLARLSNIAPIVEDDDSVPDPDQGDASQPTGDVSEPTDDSSSACSKASKRYNMSNAMVSECIQVLANNYPLDVKEDDETEFGLAYTHKNGHAHIHGVMCFSRSDQTGIETPRLLMTRIKAHMSLSDTMIQYFYGGSLEESNVPKKPS